MSSPPPRPTQHLVLEAEREHYADVRGCQDAWFNDLVSAGGQARSDRGRSRYRDVAAGAVSSACGGGDSRAADGLDERANAEAHVRLGDVERRDEADGLVVEPARDEQDIALERARDRSLGVLGVIELDRDHRAVAPELADVRI